MSGSCRTYTHEIYKLDPLDRPMWKEIPFIEHNLEYPFIDFPAARQVSFKIRKPLQILK